MEYISQERALELLSKRHSTLISIVEDAEENPLPNSVRLSQIPIQDYEKVDAFVGQFRDVLQYDEENMSKKLLDYQSQYERISKVINLMNLVKNGIFVLIGLFLFAMFIMIHTVIRNFIFFLQDEVRIIELVGGRPSFIYGPLMIQGIIYTVVAVVLAFLSVFLFHQVGIDYLPENFIQSFNNFYTVLHSKYIFIEFLVAILIGIFSAFLASYKYVYSTIRE